MDFPNMNTNDMVSISDLNDLNKALQKAATVGYQTPATTSGGDAGTMSPLVPQSLEATLASKTYTMEEIVLWKAIHKVPVSQTVHEFNVVNEHGFDLDPFIAEGGGGTTNRSSYERRSVRIKFMAERREVTDVAQMVGLVGPNAHALAEETERGTTNLMQKVERQLFHGDEDLNSLGFDGIIKQIKAGGNTTDLEGGAISPDAIQETLGKLQSAPFYGSPDCVYVEPKVHQDLIRQANAYGRHDQIKITGGTNLTFGAQHLSFMSNKGPVPLKAAPFLFTAWDAPTGGSGGSNAPALPVLDSAVAHTAGLTGTSAWTASDAGDYYWKIVAVSSGGYSAPLSSAQTAVVAGNKMGIDLDDLAVQSGTYPVTHYRIYRSEKDGLATTAKLLMEVPINTDGGSGGTLIGDYNAVKPNTSKALFVQHDRSVMEFVRLLDFLRRPLAEVATTKPFLLMLFGAPIVKVPTKCWLLENVGTTDLSA